MSQVVAHIPSGFSNDSKAAFLDAVKQMFCEKCGFKLSQSVVFISEHRPYNACEEGAKKISIIVYTTVGKSDELKEQMAKAIEDIVVDVLGEKWAGTELIYEEHTRSNVCVMGKLASRM